MLKILTPEQMRKADNNAIYKYGVPGALLMENAARSCADIICNEICSDYPVTPRILFLCGSGNNGGDGFALARHIIDHAVVSVLWIGKEEGMSPETMTNYTALLNLEVPLAHITDENQLGQINFDCDVIIDSLIGTGASGNLRGIALPMVKLANEADAIKVAIDTPTGLDVETGIAHPDAFKADITITMFAAKTGMLINDGMDICGKIYLAGLGVPELVVDELSETFSLELDDLESLMPVRKKVSSKFDYGRVLVVAGSRKYPGAAALSSNAAITAGAGLVKLITPVLHHSVLPEVIPNEPELTTEGTISMKNQGLIAEESKKAEAVLIGPGLSDNNETIELVKKLIKKLDKDLPIVLDADALKALETTSKLRKNIVLTPHPGELSKLIVVPREEIEENALKIAKEWAKKLNCIIVLKHVPVIITDGDTAYMNLNGNPGMATAGSGDVLAGIITSLIAQGIAPYEAAALGVYLHAAAGDYYAEMYSQNTLTASGLLDSLKFVLHKVYSE